MTATKEQEELPKLNTDWISVGGTLEHAHITRPASTREDIPVEDHLQRALVLRQDQTLLSEAQEITRKMESIGGSALIVGGFVRDALAGKSPKDLDLEVYGVEPEKLEDTLNELYPGKVNKQGNAFCVLAVHIAPGVSIDVSIPRRENSTGSGHKDFEVTGDPYMSVEEAARRRDFSFNALAANPITGEVIDPFGGVQDLRDGILRVTDPEKFVEDPLRVLRGVQFAARLDLVVEEDSLQLMSTMVNRGDLRHLAAERLTEEFTKLLTKAERPSIGLELMQHLGVNQALYPELDAMRGVIHDPTFHPEGDVWVHNCMVVDEAAKIIRRGNYTEQQKLEIMLGALCHDYAKPLTTTIEGGHVRQKNHEALGKEPVEAFFSRLKYADEVKESVVRCTVRHLQTGVLFRELERYGEVGAGGQKLGLDERQYSRAVRRLLRSLYPTDPEVFLAITEADHRGRAISGVQTAPYRDGERLREALETLGESINPRQKLVSGDVLKEIGLTPSPFFGAITDFLDWLQDEGTINSSKDALRIIKASAESLREIEERKLSKPDAIAALKAELSP